LGDIDRKIHPPAGVSRVGKTEIRWDQNCFHEEYAVRIHLKEQLRLSEPISWNRINPSGIEGVTTKNSFDHQKAAFERTVAGYGFEGIIRAARIKPTVSSQQGGERQFVDPDQPTQQQTNHVTVSADPVQNASPFGQKVISRLKKSDPTAVPQPLFWR
jgi:hypothetical protein